MRRSAAARRVRTGGNAELRVAGRATFFFSPPLAGLSREVDQGSERGWCDVVNENRSANQKS